MKGLSSNIESDSKLTVLVLKYCSDSKLTGLALRQYSPSDQSKENNMERLVWYTPLATKCK